MMKRQAEATDSIEEMQLLCRVTAWDFSGRPDFSAATRAMFGAEKVCPTQPARRPSTASGESLERERVAFTAWTRRSVGEMSVSELAKWPMAVRAPPAMTMVFDEEFMMSPFLRECRFLRQDYFIFRESARDNYIIR